MASAEVTHGRVLRSVIFVMAVMVLVVFTIMFVGAVPGMSNVSAAADQVSGYDIYSQDNLKCAVMTTSCNIMP